VVAAAQSARHHRIEAKQLLLCVVMLCYVYGVAAMDEQEQADAAARARTAVNCSQEEDVLDLNSTADVTAADSAFLCSEDMST
jgi:hypothetical protein